VNIWLFQTGEPIHTDQQVERPMRAINLANAFVEQGHTVVLWTAAFFHQKKIHRAAGFTIQRVSEQLTICLVPSVGYKKNVGLDRLYDHAILALNLRKALKASEFAQPDVAFVGYPPIEFAYVAGSWLKRQRIPFMLDVKDQWPDIFIRAFPKALSPLAKLAFYPYFYMGKQVLKDATALSSMTAEFLDWARNFAKCSAKTQDFVFPLASKAQLNTANKLATETDWLRQHGLEPSDHSFRIFFVGNFMASAFDFDTVLASAAIAQEQGLNWQFVLCGDGDQWSRIKANAAKLENIILPGRVNRNQMLAIASGSQVALAPIKNNPDYLISTPNKIVDYFSFGLPVITSLQGVVQAMLKDFDAGANYTPHDPVSLLDMLITYSSNSDLVSRQKKKSQQLFEQHFDGDKIYLEGVQKILRLADS
jgi:glycosyltransferase involved in cell wall biosynthesis